VLPGPDVNEDSSLRAYLRRNLTNYAHPGGTCRIGTDGQAVVDIDLRVRGIAGLRVADASVMPSAPSANTNATVYAIAERAAGLIQAQSSAAAPREGITGRQHRATGSFVRSFGFAQVAGAERGAPHCRALLPAAAQIARRRSSKSPS
jgi:choline dehydrogenase-like flavoprotein